MQPDRATRRLFVALEPTDAVRRRIGAAQAEIRRAAGRAADEIRWVAPESVHLTLQFLGSVPEERVAAVAEAVAEAARSAPGPLSLEVRGAGGFPNARRPRVVWLGVGGDLASLRSLAADLGRRLAPIGFPPEDRPFAAHLTLGRAREGRADPGIAGALAGAREEEAVAWRAVEVVLFESHLSPKGARHESVARAPLGGAGRTA